MFVSCAVSHKVERGRHATAGLEVWTIFRDYICRYTSDGRAHSEFHATRPPGPGIVSARCPKFHATRPPGPGIVSARCSLPSHPPPTAKPVPTPRRPRTFRRLPDSSLCLSSLLFPRATSLSLARTSLLRTLTCSRDVLKSLSLAQESESEWDHTPPRSSNLLGRCVRVLNHAVAAILTGR